MSAKSLIQPMSRLYDEDFVGWATGTARLLREGRFEEIEVERLAEEVEDMARRDRRELRSRLTVLIFHLLKWKQQPRKRSGSWEATILAQRAELEGLLEESPSLRSMLEELVGRVYAKAVRQAAAETRLAVGSFPRKCPFSVAQILDEDFLPQ